MTIIHYAMESQRLCLQKKNCQPLKIVCLKTENLSKLIHEFYLIHFGKKKYLKDSLYWLKFV